MAELDESINQAERHPWQPILLEYYGILPNFNHEIILLYRFF